MRIGIVSHYCVLNYIADNFSFIITSYLKAIPGFQTTSKTKIMLPPSFYQLTITSSFILLFGLMLVSESIFPLASFSAFAQDYDEPTKDSQLLGIVKNTSVGGIDISKSSPLQGHNTAPITIIEFGDYQCAECQQWLQDEKPSIKSKYIDKNKVKFYFVDYAYLGSNSVNAANASYCAAEQGMYWEYHHHLYEHQRDIDGEWSSPINLKWFASNIGLDIIAFDECFDSGRYDDRVLYNTNVGESNGVTETPVFFIIDDSDDDSTKRIDGFESSSVFARTVDKMLDNSGITSSANNAISDTETLLEDRLNVNIDENGENERERKGCLIATAVYGTEFSPQVQFLREIRDNTIMRTDSGAAFMSAFNQWYYSFSPTIADMQRENPIFKEFTKISLIPMISTLSVMTLVENDSEVQVIVLGISVIILNLGIYIVAPTLIGFKIREIFSQHSVVLYRTKSKTVV